MRKCSCSLTSEQAAYIAGFLDGEGTFGFNKMRSKSSRRGITYIGRIFVCNTNFEVLEWMKAVVGFGSIHYRKQKNRKWKDIAQLAWAAQQAKAILPLIIPYMIVRKKQAKIVLEYLNRQYISGLKLGLSDDEWAARISLVEQCSVLNKKGRIKQVEL